MLSLNEAKPRRPMAFATLREDTKEAAKAPVTIPFVFKYRGSEIGWVEWYEMSGSLNRNSLSLTHSLVSLTHLINSTH